MSANPHNPTASAPRPGQPGAQVLASSRADIPPQASVLPMGNKLARLAWRLVWLLLFRPSPSMLHGWRCFLLRLFGAQIARGVHVYPSVTVWAPWNLSLGEHACLGYNVDVYSVARIHIGARTTVSQYAHLCAATHDYTKRNYPLITQPISIGNDCWIAAEVFVGPGVTVGEGTVVGARSSVFADLPPWVVAVGSPAKPIKARELEGRGV